jgi:arginyl-tRNA synthetase
VLQICQKLLIDSLNTLAKTQNVQLPENISVSISKPSDARLGDFTSNIALQIAKVFNDSPFNVATTLISNIKKDKNIQKIEVGGAGFINFYLQDSLQNNIIKEILEKGDGFAKSDTGNGKRVLIEYVSANPTGPLHVGHGRGAAVGSALANIYKFCGYDVACEYYVNDAGRQMDILTISVYLRYLDLCGKKVKFLKNAYQGDYIWDIAANLHREHADKFYLQEELPKNKSDDEEIHMDNVIRCCKKHLGMTNFSIIFKLSLKTILAVIKKDLNAFGVKFDLWFSERYLLENKQIERALEILKNNKSTYKNDGALWFESSKMGDEKDRVLIKENRQLTYFTSDIAYHFNKYERGFDKIINIWGADHHGYIARIRASLDAARYPSDKLTIILVQFASLYRGEEQLAMTTRGGQFITLKELYKEIGVDATRFFYLMRKSDQHMRFDLELAKQKTSDNPVYYIQYAHARINSVLKKYQIQDGVTCNTQEFYKHLHLLDNKHEKQLIQTLDSFKRTLDLVILDNSVHKLCYYLQNLAKQFHMFYNSVQVLSAPPKIKMARISLITAVGIIIKNGLGLLGLAAPYNM